MQAQVKAQSDTLQQQITDTIVLILMSSYLVERFKNVWTKLRYVIIPKFNLQNNPQAVKQLRNCIIFISQNRGSMGTTHIVFSVVIYHQSRGLNSWKKLWNSLLDHVGGSFVVTVNTKLLGGHISFFQCVCVLGYCVFPIVLAAAVIYILKILTLSFLLLKILICGAAVIWASLSSLSFMNVMIEEDKKIIAVYPIFIFYIFIGWFVLFI